MSRRDTVLNSLSDVPRATPSRDDEVLGFIAAQELHGRGIGHVDAHLLASARLTPDARLWTRDRRLAETAKLLGVAFEVPASK